MGRNKNFLAWLINISNKKPLYIENGFVKEGDANTLAKTNGEPANLETETTGWRDTLVKYGRSDKYAGIIRDFTVPLTFSREAAEILRNKFWNGNSYEAQIYFALSKLDRTSTFTKYEPWFIGELDFSQYKQKKNNVEINVLEGGVSKYLKAFEATTFEIPIGANPLAVNVYMDGIPFSNKLEYTIFDQPQTAFTEVYVGMGIIVNEGTTQGIINQDQSYSVNTPGFPNELWFMKSYTKTFTATIFGSITVTKQTAGNHYIRIRIRKRSNSTGAGTTTDYTVVNAQFSPGNYTFNFNFQIPLVPEDALYFIYDSNTDIMTFFATNGTLNVDYGITFEPTVIKALRGQEVFAQLTNKLTKGLYQSNSNALRNLNQLVFTSGTAIRGNDDSTIKTSLEDFNKAIKPFFLGIGIKDDMLICEELPYFYQQNIIISLGIIDDLQIEVSTDKIFNTVKVGYRNNNYDNKNGVDEVNVTQQYTSAVTKVVKEIDLISSSRADNYGIELTRLNLTGKNTTDSKSDNESFILNINTNSETIGVFSNVYRLYRKVYSNIAGLLHPLEAFNIEFSPKRILLKWQSYFNSIFDRQQGAPLTFQSGEKNSDLVTTDVNGNIIAENSVMTIGNNKLFLPYYFTFKTQVPLNYISIMNTNPYGLIEFEYKGNMYNGFIIDGGIKPATNDVQTWKLLAGPLNDMSKLI
jgi:hypothetical protein